MPPVNHGLLAAVDAVAVAQQGLVTSAQFVEIGLARSTLAYRIRQGGPWRRVLPSVYAVSREPLDEGQRNLAALLYAGSPALITGASALRRYGVTAARRITPREVQVLVPSSRKRASTHFVHVQRSKYWPMVEPHSQTAPAGRAALDTTRALHHLNDVGAVLSEVVRGGHATLDELEAELDKAQRRRTALTRQVLRELRNGPVSVPELDLARRWAATGLPPALFNANVFMPTGEFIARPDVLLVEHGVIVEIDSREFHHAPADWDRTMRRHARLSSLGLIVLHITPARLRDDSPGVVAEIWSAIAAQQGRALPELVVRPFAS